MDLQGEGESTFRKVGLRGKLEQLFAEHAQSDLRIRAFKDRAREAEEYIASPVIVATPARRVSEGGGAFVEACAIALDMERPTCFARKPFFQNIGVPPHRHELAMRGGHQRSHEKSAQRRTLLLALVACLLQADTTAIAALELAAARGHTI